jgi:hypothetical protein
MKVQQVKQTVLAELLEAAHEANRGKYKDLWIWRHRENGFRAYWELQMLLREKLDSIGGLDTALDELITEGQLEQIEGFFRIKISER